MNRYVPGSSLYAPESLPPERTRRSTCKKCGRPLVFVQMDTGGTMPCDPTQVYGDGQRHLVVRDVKLVGHLVSAAGPNVLGLEPHWGTCPCRPRKVSVPIGRVPAQPTLFDEVPE